MEHTENENKAAGAPSALNVGLGCIDATMVKRLATQTTLDLWHGLVSDGRGLENLIAFAKAVAEYEREACARLCEEDIERYSNTVMPNGGFRISQRDADECAAAIRQRSNVELTGGQPGK